jgi:hypothetical protein
MPEEIKGEVLFRFKLELFKTKIRDHRTWGITKLKSCNDNMENKKASSL